MCQLCAIYGYFLPAGQLGRASMLTLLVTTTLPAMVIWLHWVKFGPSILGRTTHGVTFHGDHEAKICCGMNGKLCFGVRTLWKCDNVQC